MADEKTVLNEDRNAIVPVADARICSMIYTVHGRQVMLDSDLAQLYGVETKVLNQAVSRNPKCFPERFCFRVTREEAERLRSQIVTLRPELQEHTTWWRYMPRVFTEQGVSMLSAVLRSDTAIDTSVRIMDAFVEMRHFITDNAYMFKQIRDVERRASKSIFLVDGYVDSGTLNVLAKKREGASVEIWTHPKTALTEKDTATFNAQYPKLEVQRTATSHDRYLILDRTEGYFVGASLKDAGKKSFAISRIEDAGIVKAILIKLKG